MAICHCSRLHTNHSYPVLPSPVLVSKIEQRNLSDGRKNVHNIYSDKRRSLKFNLKSTDSKQTPCNKLSLFLKGVPFFLSNYRKTALHCNTDSSVIYKTVEKIRKLKSN